MVVTPAANDPLVVVVRVVVIIVVGIVFMARVNECGTELERAVQTQSESCAVATRLGDVTHPHGLFGDLFVTYYIIYSRTCSKY